MIKVEDFGKGISNQKLKNIFHPYLRPRKESFEAVVVSRGLGLSIGKYICSQLKGDLRIQSTVGKGTCVKFSMEVFTHEN